MSDAVAIDLGQTKIMAARVGVTGDLAALSTEPTAPTRATLLAQLTRLVRERAEPGTVAVGVAAAPLVERIDGTLLWPGSLPLEGFPLRAWMVERCGLPVALENDANAAALAEHRVGAGRGTRHMLLLTVGTGVGGGLILNGELYTGAGGVAGELGHITLDRHGPPCSSGCPGIGHLEALGSGTALDALAAARLSSQPGEQAADGRRAVELATAGNADAIATVAELGVWLGYGVADLVNIFNPELVVIGGGVSEAGELVLAPIREVVAERALEPARTQVRVVAASLGVRAGIIGAGIAAHDLATP